MKYKDILSQWNNLIDEVQRLQENISKCIDDEGYSNEQEKQDLKMMQRGGYELFRILLGYVD